MWIMEETKRPENAFPGSAVSFACPMLPCTALSEYSALDVLMAPGSLTPVCAALGPSHELVR